MDLRIKMDKGCENLFPTKAHEDDACFDIYSAVDTVIPSKGSTIVSTGLHMDVPTGYEVVFRGRSGMAAKHAVFAHMGTIDAGYVDECKVILFNLSDKDYPISVGDRIAQFKVQFVLPTKLHLVDKFKTESRGGGFGSTGK